MTGVPLVVRQLGGRGVRTPQLERDPSGFMRRLADEQADVYVAGCGRARRVYVASAELTRELLVERRGVLRKLPSLQPPRRLAPGSAPTLDGEEHRRARTELAPLLRRADALAQVDIFAGITDAVSAGWIQPHSIDLFAAVTEIPRRAAVAALLGAPSPGRASGEPEL
jgi:cytochrome P450